MRFFTSQITYFISNKKSKTNIQRLAQFLVILITLIVTYGVLFHVIMEMEGQQHSWITGFLLDLCNHEYPGFGDITFTSDLGRLFSMIVLGSGLIVLLIMLPFTFIEFFYAPWMEAQSRARTPRELPTSFKGHIILTSFDPLTRSLIEKLEQYQKKYVLLVSDLKRALELFDDGFKVMLGEPDNPETYKKLQIHQAEMVVTGFRYV